MVRSYFWALSGSVAIALAQWVVLIVLARHGSAHEVGQYVLGLSIASPIALFLSLGLRTLVATDHHGRVHPGTYLTLRLATAALSLLVILGVTLVGGFDRMTTWVVLFVGLAKCIELFAELGSGFLQRSGRMDVVGRVMVGKHAVTSVAALGVMLYTGSVLWTVGVVAAAGVLSLLILDVPVWKRYARLPLASLRLRWRLQEHRALIRTAAPLGMAAGLISLHVNLPRYVLERFHGTAVLGLFGALTQLAIAVSLVLLAAGHIALPRLAASLARAQYDEFRRIQRRLFLVALALGGAGISGAWILGDPALRIVYGPTYAAASPVLIVLMVWAALGYFAHVLFLGLAAFQMFRQQLSVYIASLTVTGTAAMIMVPAAGGVGAAWAMVAGVAVQIVAFGFLLHGRLSALPREVLARQLVRTPVGIAPVTDRTSSASRAGSGE